MADKEDYEKLFQIKEAGELNELRADIEKFLIERAKKLKIHYLWDVGRFNSKVYDDVISETMCITVRRKNTMSGE